ncbi:DUF485 domain-containing protein [Nocardiopsis alba]|jgi:uncharacterized membrane protein (DUF485 family)|uniref:DUF485 domain-containing protein n=2 Tax=Nocardiopsis alba TaxID=53437 RepID=A0ABV5DYG9_9ACTN|nr:DUF485 domain-containing protein [Nocardiopsis alba]AFR06890.1 hypothetical protein B005_1286 [Nocardiopsis alba ATCC BAA-2165]
MATQSSSSAKDPTPTPREDEAHSAEPIPTEAFVAMHADPRFHRLRRTLFVFVFPMTVAFLLWYALYVVLSGFARDFMAIEVAGGVNMALLLGLLQFVTTFGIAILYSWYARKRFDPLSYELRDELMGLAEKKSEENR